MQERERRRVFGMPLYLKYAVPEAVLPEWVGSPRRYAPPLYPEPVTLIYTGFAVEPEISKSAYSVAVPIKVEP